MHYFAYYLRYNTGVIWQFFRIRIVIIKWIYYLCRINAYQTKMIIQSAKFLISSPSVAKCPDSKVPEYAFIGRSNVGKSSLINCITGVKGLAMTSSKPGKTLLINYFNIIFCKHQYQPPTLLKVSMDTSSQQIMVISPSVRWMPIFVNCLHTAAG